MERESLQNQYQSYDGSYAALGGQVTGESRRDQRTVGIAGGMENLGRYDTRYEARPFGLNEERPERQRCMVNDDCEAGLVCRTREGASEGVCKPPRGEGEDGERLQGQRGNRQEVRTYTLIRKKNI